MKSFELVEATVLDNKISAEWTDAVDVEIDAAYAFIKTAQPRLAVLAFAKARQMVHDLCDHRALENSIQKERKAYESERNVYTDLLRKRCLSGRPVTIFADSLGLPRPDGKTGENLGAETCYSWMLGDALPNRQIISLCQRFLTTSHVLGMLLADPQLGGGSDVVIHVGLNDCANRMFLEEDRISLSLVSEKLREKLVTFSRLHRSIIIQHLPPRHYVPPDEFKNNLHNIMGLLKARKALTIVLSTIILPPPRSWRGTPGMNRNFADYNCAIMNAAHLYDAQLLDIDRHIWWAQRRKPLLDDGMHLSEVGHGIFALQCAALIRQPHAV